MNTFEIAGVYIPTELLVRIFSEVDRETLKACRLTCRFFNLVANDPLLYTRLPLALTASEVLCDLSKSEYVLSQLHKYPYLEEFYLPAGIDYEEGLDALLAHAPKLMSVNLGYIDTWNDTEFGNFLSALVNSLPVTKITMPKSLEVTQEYAFLRIINVFHTDGYIISEVHSETLQELYAADTPSVAQLLDNCPNIHTLTLSYANIQEALHSDHLHTLDVSTIDAPDAIQNCSEMKNLSVDYLENWEHISSVSLRSLTLHDDSDHDPPIELDQLPKLTHLSVNFVSRPINCEHLTSLTISQRTVRDSLVHTANLGRLSLQTSIPDDLPTGIHTLILDNLTYYPPEPSFFSSVLPHRLHRLTTLHHKATVSTCIESPNLEILHVNRFLTQKELLATVQACPRLRKVYLLHGRPWERESNTMEAKNKQWGDFQALEGLPSVYIPLDLSRTQGPVFSELLLAGRVMYFG